MKQQAPAARKGHSQFEGCTSEEDNSEEGSGEDSRKQFAHVLMRVAAPVRSFAMVASGIGGTRRIKDQEELDRIAALKAKEFAAAAASEKKRDKRARQKDEKKSAVTPELRATLDKAKADKEKREAEEAAALRRRSAFARRSFGLLPRSQWSQRRRHQHSNSQ